MKIALLSTGFLGNKGIAKEATAITITDFAKELVRSNNEVVIISEKRDEKVRFEEKEGLIVYRTGSLFKGSQFRKFSIYNRILAHVLAIRKMQKKLGYEFEVVHSFSANPLLALRGIMAKIISRKAIVMHTLKSYSREKIGSSFYRILNFVDLITVPTTIFAEHLIKKGVDTKKIRIVRSHINTQKFFPKDRKQLKERYGLINKKVVLYYGAMWEKKGTDLLIKAIPAIVERYPRIKLIFVPRNLPYASKYFSELNQFRDKVKLITGPINLPQYVAMADLVVLPYPNLIGTEGNPSCLLEAMACKTPVVTTNLPELKEIAEGCVFFAKPGDVGSLAETINNALENPNPAMVEKAYHKAQEFSVEKITQEFLNLYEEAIQDNKKTKKSWFRIN